jgi:hypothetical protein
MVGRKIFRCLSCGEEFSGGIKAVKKHICKSVTVIDESSNQQCLEIIDKDGNKLSEEGKIVFEIKY